MRILILDDDTELLSALKRILDDHGHDVDCADNAEKAAEMVVDTVYDLLLVDYKMPGHDGIWFMQNAKLPRKTKVLLCTAYANRDVIKKMFDLGACGYLIKPFDEAEVLRNLEFHVG